MRRLTTILTLAVLATSGPGCATTGRTGTDPDPDATADPDAITVNADATVPDGGPCQAPEVWCEGACVDLQTRPDHCGACTAACSVEALCEGGECTVHLSGNLSGRVSYPDAVVVLDADVAVTAYNGADDVTVCDPGETGCLVLEARSIIVAAGASILGTGRGHGGGGGGGGGTGNSGPASSCSGCTSCTVGSGGPGSAGGQPGDLSVIGAGQSISGAGGDGGGPFGGGGGSSRVSSDADGARDGHSGSPGGYATAGGNGDTTTDESVRLGSGGGGGSGGACAYEPYYSSVGGSGGGGAGNPGGAYIKLLASERVEVLGSLYTAGVANAGGDGGNGTDGQNGGYTCDLTGSGGDGGSAWNAGGSNGGNGVNGYFQAGYNTCIDRQCENGGSHAVSGGDGGDGGAGAGGGILIKAPTVLLEGFIDAAGGQTLANGGTVKIFHQGIAPPTATIAAGRIHLQPY